jgi:ATP-dependent Lon protease
LLAPLLTRFTVIHLKPYTKEEFVEIAVNVLNRDEGIEKDVAKFIMY